MGVSKYTNIGPYLVVKGNITKDIPKVKRICPNHPKKETNDKFCSQCGTEIISREYIEQKVITPSDFILREFEDKLYIPEYGGAIMPNANPPKNVAIDNDSGGSADLTDSSEIMFEQIAWFNNKYANELALLREAFGSENVQVKWGVTIYWS